MPKVLSPSMLTWLRAFDASARHRSFTSAANELCITQGAISQQVKHLEQALGFTLLLRQPRAMELTPQGRRLASVTDQAFGALREAVSEIALPGGRVPIVLSCSPSFAVKWVTPRLNDFATLQPKIDLRVFGEFHQLTRSRMVTDCIEAGIRYDDTAYQELNVTPLCDEYLFPVASPAFLAANPGLKSARDLKASTLLHDSQPWFGAADDEEWGAYLAAMGLHCTLLASGKRFNLSLLAIGAALAGEGIAVGRLALIIDDLEAGRLLPLFDVAIATRASYKFVSLPGAPPRIGAISTWLRQEAQVFQQRARAFLTDHHLTIRSAL